MTRKHRRHRFSFVPTGDHRYPWQCTADGFVFYFTQSGFGLLHANYRAGRSAVTIKGLFRYCHHWKDVNDRSSTVFRSARQAIEAGRREDDLT